MNFKIIAAATRNFGIGYKNNLPWHIPEDLKYFSKTTIGDGNNAVIMGRNTWESIGSKPLPKRHNVIVSTTLDPSSLDNSISNKVTIVEHPDDAFHYCRNEDFDESWIIGGEKIYKHFMAPEYIAYRKRISDCYITNIPGDYDCDAFFPINEYWMLNHTFKLENSDLEVKHFIPFLI